MKPIHVPILLLTNLALSLSLSLVLTDAICMLLSYAMQQLCKPEQQNNACRHAVAGSMKLLSIDCSLRSPLNTFGTIFHSGPSCDTSLHNLGFQLGQLHQLHPLLVGHGVTWL